MIKLTQLQLDALLELLNPRQGQTPEILRLVLVDGIAQAEAARRTGVSRMTVSSAVRTANRIITNAAVLCANDRSSAGEK